MKALHLLAAGLAMAALLSFAATEADAQQRPVGGPRITLPSHSNHFSWERKHGFHGGFGGVFIVEREVPVIVEREVVREVVREVPAKDLGTPNRDVPKPYVIGNSYPSVLGHPPDATARSQLPSGCMKLIEDGASYYYCSGEWYRQTGKLYRAVARKL